VTRTVQLIAPILYRSAMMMLMLMMIMIKATMLNLPSDRTDWWQISPNACALTPWWPQKGLRMQARILK
jgi:hypothetical protein